MKRALATSLALLLVVPGFAVDPPGDAPPYTVTVSTEPAEDTPKVPKKPTKTQKRQMERHKPVKAPMKQIRSVERSIERALKKTAPNPKVVAPSFSPLPVHSPTIEKTPEMPVQKEGESGFFATAAKVMTKSWGSKLFVWLPAISTDPNTGPTGGIMPVLVLTDPDTKKIEHLLAPSYTYNGLFGQTATMRYYWYPTDTSQFVTLGSYSQHYNREAKIRYENTSLFDGALYVRGEGFYDADASRRFYGLGPNSRKEDESGYISKESVFRASAGFNFANSWRATFGQRYRQMEIDDNVIPDIPDLRAQFPTTKGTDPIDTIATEFRLLWDTRDLPVTPSRGSSGELFFESDSVDLSDNYSDYVRYGVEGKRFFRWKNPKQLTMIHGLYEWANGSNIPFYELPKLGGRDTLRGYGDGRFVDRGRIVLNVEQRMTFASLQLLGIQTNFEFAPFFDIGSVFPTFPEVQANNFRPVYGTAFRVAVKPNVVGDVEVGYGKEGVAVFVDLNYPF